MISAVVPCFFRPRPFQRRDPFDWLHCIKPASGNHRRCMKTCKPPVLLILILRLQQGGRFLCNLLPHLPYGSGLFCVILQENPNSVCIFSKLRASVFRVASYYFGRKLVFRRVPVKNHNKSLDSPPMWKKRGHGIVPVSDAAGRGAPAGKARRNGRRPTLIQHSM